MMTIYKQNTIHKGQDDTEVGFEMNEESDGSIRIMDFIPILIDLRLNEAVYLIDEIDRSIIQCFLKDFLSILQVSQRSVRHSAYLLHPRIKSA